MVAKLAPTAVCSAYLCVNKTCITEETQSKNSLIKHEDKPSRHCPPLKRNATHGVEPQSEGGLFDHMYEIPVSAIINFLMLLGMFENRILQRAATNIIFRIFACLHSIQES